MIKPEGRILAVVENPLEVECLGPVARSLSQQSSGRVETVFTDQDPLLGQEAREAVNRWDLERANITIPVDLSTPLLEVGKIRQLAVLLRVSRAVRPVVEFYDAVLCGVDSVIARMLVQEANRQGKLTYQVLPSLYLGGRDTELREKVRHALRYVAGTTLGIPFLKVPLGVSRSGFDRIFVMGERVRKALENDGIRSERIEVTGVPRFAELFRKRQPQPPTGAWNEDGLDLLFVLGAYRWHGRPELEKLQEEQLVKLVDAVSKHHRSHQIFVRLHPRGEGIPSTVADRRFVDVLEPGHTDIVNNILEADIVVSHRSTALYEAATVGRVAVLLQFSDDSDRMGEAMACDFVSVTRIGDLLSTIEGVCESERSYRRVLVREQRRARQVIDPDCATSADLIAKRILQGLELTDVP